MAGHHRAACLAFLEDLYADAVCARDRLVLWNSTTKRSAWLQSVDEVVGVLERTPTTSDLYYGVCLQGYEAALEERRRRNKDPQATLDYARGYASTAAVMPGLWLDLDIAGSGHEKRGLPRNQVEADRILEALPCDPTWIVQTGGGMHVYWLWREPWVLETEEERRQAAALIKGWQQLAIDLAANMGYAVDSTHDLSRVLRPVGTVNTKYGTTVEFRQTSDHRFNPSDFEEWEGSVDDLRPPSPARIAEVREDLQPPTEKLLAMLNLNAKFAETWRRERKEFPSQSEYDLSLAAMAARSGWKDDEIVALVVTHRRQGGENLKLGNGGGYYQRLISKARQGLEADEAHERLSDRVEAVQQGEADIEDERASFLADVSALLGFKIRRILKFVTDPPQYRLILDEGQIHLGGVESILSSSKFRASIAAVSGTLIQRFNGQRWDPVAQAILQAVEELDLGSDSTADGIVSEWLGEYLVQHRPSADREEAIPLKHPFVYRDDTLCFFLAEFRSWLGFYRDERMSRKQLATILRSANSEPVVVNYTRATDGKKTTVNCWTVPTGIALRLPVIPKEATMEEEDEEVPF